MGEQEVEEGAERQPGLLWSYLHLAVLSTFALAQPLFDLLSDNPEFFAARGSTAMDVIVFAVLLVVVPPTLLLAIEWLIGRAGERPRRIAHHEPQASASISNPIATITRNAQNTGATGGRWSGGTAVSGSMVPFQSCLSTSQPAPSSA